MPVPFQFPDSPGPWEEILREIFGSLLTETQLRIAARRVVGWTDSRIAGDLYIAVGTVRGHTARILLKFGRSNVQEIPIFCFCKVWERYR